MGLVTNAQDPDLKRSAMTHFLKTSVFGAPSNPPVNIEEISGCFINSRTWILMRNFAAKLIAELEPFRLQECLVKCIEMGVNPFPLEIILSQAHSWS